MNIKLKLFLFSILISLGSASFAVDNGTWTYDVNSNGTSITLTGCSGSCPKDLTIPATIDGYSTTIIGTYAFVDLQLTSVSIPDSVTAIDERAFSFNSLSTVIIPDSVVTIGAQAFRRSSDAAGDPLTTLTLGRSVKTIGEKAFWHNQLSRVIVPAGVITIGSSAFADNALTLVRFLSNRPILSRSTSFSANSNLDTIEYCSTATGWPGDSILNGQFFITPTSNSDICPSPDSDNDTLPDSWEIANGRNPSVPDYLLRAVGSRTCLKDDEGIKCWGIDSSVETTFSGSIGVFDGYSAICYDLDSELSCTSHSAPLTGNPAETPIPDSLDKVVDFGVGEWSMCAITVNSELECWQWYGEGGFSNPPISSAEELEAGQKHACAISSNQIVCWGRWVGSGWPNNSPPSLTNPRMLRSANRSGGPHSCAFADEGFKCWGTWQDQGSFGTWTIPDLVETEVIDYALSYVGGCALKSDDSTICWGGRNTPLDYSTLAFSLENSKQISLGNELCLLSDTGVTCSDSESINLMIDPDGDGFSTQNGNDAFPLDSTEWLDTDLDGIGNNVDTDDDGDGVSDSLDAFPLDKTETTDTDGDGIGNNTDTDDDGDGLLDGVEASYGTNPLLADTDGDGYSDLDEVNSNSDPLDANSIPTKGLPIWLLKAAKDKMEQDATN